MATKVYRILSVEELKQYNIVKPVREKLRGKGLEEIPNSGIMDFISLGFTFSETEIEFLQISYKAMLIKQTFINNVFEKQRRPYQKEMDEFAEALARPESEQKYVTVIRPIGGYKVKSLWLRKWLNKQKR